ncbi:MAG TPA: M23 family metallopeptidase [Kineosporiaceae bacterium]|nr:M23 family metallopeptidase [Kineosporiaceae bacterium]
MNKLGAAAIVVGLPVIAAGAFGGLVIVTALGSSSGNTSTLAVASSTCTTQGEGKVATLTTEQSGNARIIVATTLEVVTPLLGEQAARHAAVIAVATSMQESTLRNIGYGDAVGPDSRGLFQQRAPWGPLADRMNPAAATRMFLNGGAAPGTPGLLSAHGWQDMAVTYAAQAVQRSAFPTAYAKWEGLAGSVVSQVVGSTVTTCTTPTRQAGTWTNPLPAGTYTKSSPFGVRWHPIYGQYRMHSGQDLAAPTGTPVRAASRGTVVFAGVSGSMTSGFGLLVTIEHPDGTRTLYGHLSKIDVNPNQQVTTGQTIGAVGSTGGSTGPHLHYQVERGETAVDPARFMTDHGVNL